MKQVRERKITGRQELRLLRRVLLIVRLVVRGTIPFDEVMALTTTLIERFAPDILRKNGDRSERGPGAAELRRAELQAWFHSLGIMITIPMPIGADGKPIANREFVRKRSKGKELFYRPARSVLTYDAFMTAVGNGDDWTVADEAERAKISWDPTDEGYWFWAEVNPSCPRTRVSWNTLTANTTINLLSIEEYVIVWWERKSKGIVLDISTWSWLRTRYNVSRALSAYEYDGEVGVDRSNAGYLAGSFDFGGGRCAEVVKITA